MDEWIEWCMYGCINYINHIWFVFGFRDSHVVATLTPLIPINSLWPAAKRINIGYCALSEHNQRTPFSDIYLDQDATRSLTLRSTSVFG